MSGDFTYRRLDRRELRRVADAVDAPEAAEGEEGVLVAGSDTDVSRLIAVVRSLLAQERRDEKLIDLLLEGVEPVPMDRDHLEQLHREAEARASFLTEVPLLSSREVGELLGSTAENTSAMANRLKRGGKLIAVTHKGVDLYPAAQIVEGDPSPAMEHILRAFAGESAWTVALWLRAPSGWLGGERPLDRLAEEPDRVVEAARKTSEPLAV